MISLEKQGAVSVLSVEATLNAESAEGLLSAFNSPVGRGLPQFVLDLSHVPLVDSSGLEAVLDARAAVRARGGVVKLSGPRPLVADILTATGVGEQFEVFPSVKAAVGSFSR